MNEWQDHKEQACKLAKGMGWFLGQTKDKRAKPELHRPGKPPEQFPTWLSALTELMRLRELLPKSKPIPVAQHAPPIARRVTQLGQSMRRAGPEDAGLPHGKIL